jgi:hypothetical protein
MNNWHVGRFLELTCRRPVMPPISCLCPWLEGSEQSEYYLHQFEAKEFAWIPPGRHHDGHICLFGTAQVLNYDCFEDVRTTSTAVHSLSLHWILAQPYLTYSSWYQPKIAEARTGNCSALQRKHRNSYQHAVHALKDSFGSTSGPHTVLFSIVHDVIEMAVL